MDEKKYTWFSHNPVKKARLDFFLVSSELLSCIESSHIKPGYRTDHSIVEINLKFSNFKREKGFWRFNNLLLRDKEYCTIVKKVIADTKEQYAATPYAREPQSLSAIDNNSTQFTISDQQFFEQLLLNIRGETISYASARKKRKDKRHEELDIEITNMEQNNSEPNDPTLMQYKEERESIRSEKNERNCT